MTELTVRETRSGVVIPVKLTPRAGRERLVGIRQGLLRAEVHAAPVKGEANRSLIRLLAGSLKIPAGSFSILRGEKSRVKLIAIAGMSRQELQRRLDEPSLG